MKDIPESIGEMHIVVLTKGELKELIHRFPYRQLSDPNNPVPCWRTFDEKDKWDVLFNESP